MVSFACYKILAFFLEFKIFSLTLFSLNLTLNLYPLSSLESSSFIFFPGNLPGFDHLCQKNADTWYTSLSVSLSA